MKALFLSLFHSILFCGFVSAQQPKLMIPVGHTGLVYGMDVSPDSKFLATGEYDKNIFIWDIESSKLVRILNGHESIVHSVDFSSDSKFLISGSEDNTVKLWDLTTGEMKKSFIKKGKPHRGNIFHLLLKKTDRPVPPNRPRAVKTISYSEDGKKFIAGAGDSLKIWNLETGKQEPSFAIPNRDFDFKTLSADLSLTAAETKDTIQIWDIEKKEVIQTISGFKNYIVSMAISPDNKKLVIPQEKSIKIYDINSGQPTDYFNEHSDRVLKTKFSPDGNYLASVGREGSIIIWDMVMGDNIHTINDRFIKYRNITFDSEGKNIYASNRKGMISQWDMDKKEMVSFFQSKTARIDKIAKSKNEKYLAISFGLDVTIWDIEKGKVQTTITTKRNFNPTICLSPDGQKLVTTGSNFQLNVWNTESGKLIKTLKGHKNYVSSITFSKDGNQLLTGSWDGTARIWDLKSGKKISSYSPKKSTTDYIGFSPDEKHILLIQKRKLHIFDKERGNEISKCTSSDGHFTTFTIAKDQSYILTGSASGQLYKWSYPELKYLDKFKIHKDDVINIELAEDNNTFYSNSKDNILAKGTVDDSNRPIKKNELIHLESMTSIQGSNIIVASNDNYGIHLYNAKNLKKIATLSFFSHSDWLVSTPEGKYDGTQMAIDQIYYTDGMEILNNVSYKEEQKSIGLWKKLID